MAVKVKWESLSPFRDRIRALREVMSVRQICSVVGAHEATVRRWLHEEFVPDQRRQKQVGKAIDKWLKEGKLPDRTPPPFIDWKEPRFTVVEGTEEEVVAAAEQMRLYRKMAEEEHARGKK